MHTANAESTAARIHRAYDKGWWSGLQSLVKRNRVALTVLAALAILLLGYSAKALLASTPDYMLVIDSGSTGTRLYAYTWRERRGKLPLLEAVSIRAARHKLPRRAAGDRRAYERLETEPGLDHYVDDPQGLQQRALHPLLEWAEAVVPRQQWRQTPLFLFGTAGLRKLAPEAQERLMTHIQGALADSAFRFEPSWARVISGVDEGIFGWIALNYLTGHLAPHPLTAPKSPLTDEAVAAAADQLSSSGSASRVRAAEHGLETVGALDLGGSSLEVSFVPSERPAADAEVNVTIMGVQYSLYTYVHHHYGLNDAFDRSVTLLLTRPSHFGGSEAVQQGQPLRFGLGNSGGSPGGLGIAAQRHRAGPGRQVLEAAGPEWISDPDLPALHHPCLFEGYDKSYRRMDYNGVAPDPPVVRLLGRPDWDACAKLAAAVVNASAPCSKPPCALGTPQLATSNKFYALTGFFVVYHFFGLQPSAGLAELENAARQFCATPWPVINATRGREIHVDRYCFRVPYVTKLLREGLGVPESQIQIGSGREGWTLGAALAEGSRVGVGQGIDISKSQAGIQGWGWGLGRSLGWLIWICAAAFSAVWLGLLLYTTSWQTCSPGRLLNRKTYDSSPLSSPTLASAASVNVPIAAKVYHGGAPIPSGGYPGLLLANGPSRALSMPSDVDC
ncbi:hypothetical protein WJX72_004780 [[Myrmecia] bisecta]|uniref:Apyrase n=1 Tax=[Myrmecia] bisecta TaxID=41462 RepID=A0AAW1PGP9_9CHLO